MENIPSRDEQILAFGAIASREWYGPKKGKGLKDLVVRIDDDAKIQGLVAGYVFRATELGEEIETSLSPKVRDDLRHDRDLSWYCGR